MASALSSPPVGNRESLKTLAANSFNRSVGLDWSAYFPSSTALLHYRYRDYDTALAHVQESRRRNNNPNFRPHLPELMNGAVESMCLTGKIKLTEAEAALAKTEALMDSMRGAPISNGANMFHDWLVAELLYLEAREAIYEMRYFPKP